MYRSDVLIRTQHSSYLGKKFQK
jgi:hypothetical protein